ncbi:MAG: hypothetical protein AAGD96_30975 [Chloroflexota bacterium]
MIYYIRQEFLSFGNSFTILDEYKQDAFFVERETFTWGSRFSLTSDTGKELAYIKQESFMFPTYVIYRDGSPFATLSKEFAWFSQKFTLDVPGPNDYEIEGTLLHREFEFRRKGSVVATVSKSTFSLPEYYGVAINKDEDVVTILASCIAIDRVIKDMG